MNCLRQANMKYKLILFDLDGTLLDTSPGIFNSVRFALKESGLPQLPDNQLSDFVGPPPKQMYMKKFGLDDKAAFEVAKKHREYGRTRAIYEAKQYPDIESTIRTLKEYGCKLGVATLKSQGIAETVLKNQDLYSYMDVVVGMNDSETMTKADTIRQAMSTLCIANNVLMVGDSVYDFEGAVKVGVDFIGVLYVCKKLNCKITYISTDYVFDDQGTEPWQPDCKDYKPLNVYGQTKLEGELAVSQTLEKYFIVRIAWVFGLNGKNFIKTMLNVGKTHDTVRVVNDQIGTPTYTYDLARLLVDMNETEKYGYYHATNEGGYISWYDFTKEIYRQAGYKTEVLPVSTEEYGLSKAARPFNSRLDKSKLAEAGFTPLPTWQDALSRYLKEIEQ